MGVSSRPGQLIARVDHAKVTGARQNERHIFFDTPVGIPSAASSLPANDLNSKRNHQGIPMSTNDTYLAVFLGSKTGPRWMAWQALPDAERRTKEREGMAAWKAWVDKHQAAIVAIGGPLGKTKKVTAGGIADVSNAMGAFTVVRAESHAAAAKLFENHPHFAIFPGESVEIMPILPIPSV
jgi:hypothetical protein